MANTADMKDPEAPRSRGNRPRRRPLGFVTTIVAEAFGILAQLLLVYTGLRYLFIGDSDEDVLGPEELLEEHTRLAAWCVLATLYLLCTIVWLNIDLRVRERDHQVLKQMSAVAIVRLVSTVTTFSSSLVGFAAAITLILIRGDPEMLTEYEVLAVWAMLVSWAMFHWGYSRIYHSRYYSREAERPLRFPGTKQPRLLDFVYFAFTNGASFAASDVQVKTTRMRWTVVWHTTLSFFFNGLIIVLTMNTIAGGFRLQG